MLAIINPTMARVASIIKKLDMDATMRSRTDSMDKWIRDFVTHCNYFREKGREESIKEARAKRRAEARKKASEETRSEIVLNSLKSGLDLNVIANITGLSISII